MNLIAIDRVTGLGKNSAKNTLSSDLIVVDWPKCCYEIFPTDLI